MGNNAIFLSASVPDPIRAPKHAATADSVAIAAAVSALVYVTLGRRLLIWGGHPAITPMIWVVAEGLGVDYGEWVRLYQSNHFKDEFPDDNKHFRNVTYIDDVDHDRQRSLKLMRERMFSDHNYTAAVFIGGMAGVIDEFDIFVHLQPNARKLPIASTGGASIDIADKLGEVPPDLSHDLDYVTLFHRHLGIPYEENRYRRLREQPTRTRDRLWRPD